MNNKAIQSRKNERRRLSHDPPQCNESDFWRTKYDETLKLVCKNHKKEK